MNQTWNVMTHKLGHFSALQIFEILNRIVTSVFDSKRVQLFEIFEYLLSPISYLKKLKNDVDFSPQQPRLATNKINVILAHYGPPSTETPTTETTTVRCHKNSLILFNKYLPVYWWLLRPTITIQFDSKWKKHYLHSTSHFLRQCILMLLTDSRAILWLQYCTCYCITFQWKFGNCFHT